ncbi:Cytosolic sulfotransferase 5 [Linum perenne]
MPKAGTTWLKSLSHCILFRDVEEEDDLLTTTNPHNCVPTFESTLFIGEPSEFPAIDPAHFSDRQLFHTHVPYNNLPDSIKNHSRGCKLVYVAREPKDTLEDLRRDPKPHVRKLASFMGRPFKEADDVEVEKVIWRSSFDRLKDLDVNNSHFFRRGEVGDWRNHLTSEMAERIDDVTRVKLQGTGLYLEDEEVAIA